MKTSKRKVLTIWSPRHCPIDTGGDHNDIRITAAIAIELAIREQIVVTVSLDNITGIGGNDEKRSGEIVMKIDGKKFTKAGRIRCR